MAAGSQKWKGTWADFGQGADKDQHMAHSLNGPGTE